MGVRVVYGSGLENRRPARDRGFESLPIRQFSRSIYAFYVFKRKRAFLFMNAFQAQITTSPRDTSLPSRTIVSHLPQDAVICDIQFEDV
jgi:hypothetical protein